MQSDTDKEHQEKEASRGYQYKTETLSKFVERDSSKSASCARNNVMKDQKLIQVTLAFACIRSVMP